MTNHPDLERMLRLLAPPLVSIPTAGKAIGIGKDRAYEAADKGQLPTLPLGKQTKVVTARLKEMLGIAELSAATSADAPPAQDR